MTRHALLIGTAMAMMAEPRASAQGAPSAPTSITPAEDAGIVVTARRQRETLQDVPASITVFSADTLAAAGAVNTADFVQLTPGVTIVTGTAEVGDTQINIRGLNGARDAEPSVALVVDGIVKTNTAALNQEQGDISQVEILKGPQGALYGRNAAAGAVVISTRKPGDHFEGRFKTSYAEDNTVNAFASLSGPLTDRIGLLVSGDYRRTDGQYQIVNNQPDKGQYVDRYDSFNVNARLIAKPNDKLTLDAKAKYGEVKAGAVVFNVVFALPAFAQLIGNPDFDQNVNDHRFVFQPNIAPRNVQSTIEGSLKGDYDLGVATITAWTAYSRINQDFSADGTSGAFGFFNQDAPCRASIAALSTAGFKLPSPLFLGGTPEGSLIGAYSPSQCDGTQYQVRNQEDISGEVRIAGDPKSRFRWQAGVYGLGLNREVGVNLGIDRGFGVIRQLYTNDPRNPTEQLVSDRFRTRVFAVFGSLDSDITQTVTLSAAARYDNEQRKVYNRVPPDARTQYVDFNGPPFTGGAPLNPGLLAGPILPKEKTFDQVEPKVSIAWKPTPHFTAFADYGRGFKSGGFNNQGSQATIDLNFNQAIGTNLNISDQFKKETSDAFEGGFKVNTAGGRLSFEGAGYYTQVENLQFFEFFVGSFGLLRVVSNIDRVDIWGGELSASFRPVRGWTLYSSVNALGSRILANSARPDTVGNKSPYTSDYTINVGTQIEEPINDQLNMVFRVDARVTGPTWFSTVQAQTNPTVFGVPGDFSKTERAAFTTINLRAGLESHGIALSLFATNLLDERYLEEVIPAPEFGGSFISPGTKRRVGVEASYKF